MFIFFSTRARKTVTSDLKMLLVESVLKVFVS